MGKGDAESGLLATGATLDNTPGCNQNGSKEQQEGNTREKGKNFTDSAKSACRCGDQMPKDQGLLKLF